MKSRPASNHGFALVIALSLMAFILLLILSITTLVRVETQSANIQLAQLEARMNAQLGAMVALGDLQRYTGPDQRVTARADILTAPGPSDIAGQSRWTGVWSSKEITNDSLDQEDGLDSRQPRWLVSGNDPSATALDPNAQLTVETANLATLGGSVTDKSNINQDDTVKAPKVEILGDDNVPEGHYAYWVSDEGVKARVNMADPHLDSSDTEAEYYRTAMAQVADPTAVSNSDGDQLLTGANSRWKDETQDPGKIGSLKNIPMFLEDDLGGVDLGNVSREFFHDFTVHSSGVLANTKDGGLKRDLSTALLSLPSDMSGPMFEPAGGSVALGDPGGPKWEQLADYFSLAKSGSGNPIDFRMPTPDQVGVSPVVTRFNYVVQVFAERLSTASNAVGYIDQVTDYNYYVGMFPLITLWNPYDKDLSIPDLGLQFDMRGIVLRDKADAGDLVAMLLNRNDIKQPSGQGGRRMIGMTIGGGIIPAGRAVNYTPPINSKISLTDASKNVLKQGASDTYIRGFFYGPTNIASDAVFPKAEGKPFFVDNNGNPTASGRPIPFGSTRDVGKGNEEIVRNDATSTNYNDNGGGHWSTVINLYANPSLNEEKRFFTLTGPGIGRIYFYKTNHAGKTWNLNKLPRVVVLSQLGVSSSTIKGVGTSVSASYDDYSDFNLQEINQLSGALANVVAIKNFPKLEPTSEKEEPARAINLLSQFNPRTTKSYRQVHMEEAKKDAGNKGSGAWKEPNMGYVQYASGPRTQFMTDMYRNWVGGTDDLDSHIGLGNSSSAEGSDKMVLFEAPSRPPVSIGQLMHANLLNTSEISSQFDSVNGWTTNHQQVHTAPAYAIGNSIANVHLPLTETRVSLKEIGNNTIAQKPDGTPSAMFPPGEPLTWKHGGPNTLKGSVYDYSYELNNVLWDEYFLSGLDSDNVKFPLPDSQLKRRPIEGFVLDQETELGDERLAAAHLMLDGAFNINSTSVAAWESILGAMRDIYTLGDGVSEPEQLHNYSRFVSPIMKSVASPFSDPLDPDIGSSNVSYSSPSDREAITAGYRSLTDKEIAKLAEKLVDEIRRRSSVKGHPFLSLSNFVNRSIDQDDFKGPAARKRFMYTGALQSAIDQSGLNGKATFNALGVSQSDNDGLWEDGYVYEPFKGATPSASSEYFPYLEDSVAAIEDRPLIEGTPGFLMQADILSKIGGKLSARSDTFMIRSYGNSAGPFTDSSEAESYFELVVQRAPEYLDSSGNNTPDAEPDSLSALNEDFGRRYEIVSHRWINKGDI